MNAGERLARSLPFVLVILLSGVYCASPGAAADNEFVYGEVDAKIGKLQPVVRSDFATEKTLKAAQRDLRDLLKKTDAAMEAAGRDESPSNPIVRIHTKIVNLLTTIEARLPPEEHVPGRSRRSPLPVPQYSDQKVIGKAANVLWDSQQKLADHLRSSSSRTKETQELVTNMILAQENLAWEVGWPFTAKEAAAMKKDGKLTGDVYLSRRGRGVERINEHLRKDAQSAGRESTGTGFAIHAPKSKAGQQALGKRLIELRGEAVKDWTKGTQPFDEKHFLQPARRR